MVVDLTASRIVCWQGHVLQVLKAPGAWDEAATAALAGAHCSGEAGPPAGATTLPPASPDILGVTVVVTTAPLDAGGVVNIPKVGGLGL